MDDQTPVVDPVSGEGDISQDADHQEAPAAEDGAPVAPSEETPAAEPEVEAAPSEEGVA